MYHIADLKRFVRCPRYYFLSRDDEVDLSPYLRSDESIIDLLIEHLHINDYLRGNVGDLSDVFFDNKEKYEWFCKTRFELDGFRINIPLMHKTKDAYDLYFIYRGTNIKELDYYYYRCNLELLRKLNISINEIYIVYINPEYIFENEINVEQLFIITNHFNGRKIIDVLDNEIVDYKETIRRIEATDINSYLPKKSRNCHFHNNLCPYYDKCFEDEKNYPCDSILTLISSRYKEEMFSEGIKLLKDADINRLEGNRIQYAQIMASRNGGVYYDEYNLKKFLGKMNKRPISFIDFEWDTYLIPKYDGMKPLDVLPFEYALYILDENDELKNYSFVGGGDCRREFVEALLNKLPKQGPIIAYNAYGAEVRRLKELADYFPEYENELNEICSRFIDLSLPFIEGIVYDIRFRGNLTLKSIVNAISEYDYKDLEINDGIKAVKKWRAIELGQGDENTINELIEYCNLDAYGLFLVYKWLKKLLDIS